MRDQSFVGGMNIEVPFYGFRRYGATIPFARLFLTDAGLTIATKLVAIPKRSRSLTLARDDVAGVFRSRGIFSWGVGIDTVEGKTHFFWTFQWRKVMGELTERGYAVETDRMPGAVYLMGLPRFRGHANGRPPAPASD